MPDMIEFNDDLGPAKIVHIWIPGVELRAAVVVDNTSCGPAIGGVRMASDVDTEEAFRLARAMTLKNAAAGLPHGGGKSVIAADPSMPLADKERLMRAFAQSIRTLDEYIPGPDMGTDERCMAWVHDEIGRAVGLPEAVGGIPLDEIGATGFGVAMCADVAQPFADVKLAGSRVVIQGFGAVGRHAARFLTDRGAKVVAVSDSRGAVIRPDGIDVKDLSDHKASGLGVADYPNGERIDSDALVDVECEIWIPAARPDVIHAGNADRLRAKLVVSGANVPVTAEAEDSLHERGIVVVPDFVANAGGVICAAFEYAGGTRDQAFAAIEERICRNTRDVLAASQKEGVTPRAAATRLALERVRAAGALKRFA